MKKGVSTVAIIFIVVLVVIITIFVAMSFSSAMKNVNKHDENKNLVVDTDSIDLYI